MLDKWDGTVAEVYVNHQAAHISPIKPDVTGLLNRTTGLIKITGSLKNLLDRTSTILPVWYDHGISECKTLKPAATTVAPTAYTATLSCLKQIARRDNNYKCRQPDLKWLSCNMCDKSRVFIQVVFE